MNIGLQVKSDWCKPNEQAFKSIVSNFSDWVLPSKLNKSIKK